MGEKEKSLDPKTKFNGYFLLTFYNFYQFYHSTKFIDLSQRVWGLKECFFAEIKLNQLQWINQFALFLHYLPL